LIESVNVHAAEAGRYTHVVCAADVILKPNGLITASHGVDVLVDHIDEFAQCSPSVT